MPMRYHHTRAEKGRVSMEMEKKKRKKKEEKKTESENERWLVSCKISERKQVSAIVAVPDSPSRYDAQSR